MKALLQSTTIILLFMFVRCTDLAITSGMAKSYIRAAVYLTALIMALLI